MISDSKSHKLFISLILGLFVFLIAIFISAFWNQSGVINAIASYLMLGEPIIFLATIICIPISLKSLRRIERFVMWSVIINFVLAAVQKPLIDAGKLYAQGFNGTDGCGGVFFVSGAGNYVSASVSIAFALYYMANKKSVPVWMRFAMLLGAFWQVLFSDSKQLVLGYIIAWILLVLMKSSDFSKAIKLLIGMIISMLAFIWCVQNIEYFRAFQSWARPELYGADGEAWYAKFYSLRVILSKFGSPLNWLFGLGPGHTVSRLGGWFLQDYKDILAPLGATTTSIGLDSRAFIENYWLTSGSTLFSPIFGWAGVFGDLGLFGTISYMYMGYIVWKNLCFDDSLKVTLLYIFSLGFIFTQLEEPGYMISVAMLLGLAWHERRLKSDNRQLSTPVLPTDRVIY